MRKDFPCKWHYTRSKKVKTVSLEERMEDGDSGMYTVFDPAVDFTEQVAGARARKDSTMFVDTLVTASQEFFTCRSKREARAE